MATRWDTNSCSAPFPIRSGRRCRILPTSGGKGCQPKFRLVEFDILSKPVIVPLKFASSPASTPWTSPMEQNILKLFRRPNYRPLNSAELLRQLGLPQNKQRQLEHVLAQLERTGQIARIKQGKRYALPLEADLVPGRIRMNRQGIGLVQPDDPKLPAIRIPHD